MINDEITIFLNTQDAIMFRSYQQFHATFALMVKSGVFDCKNGSITIHFGPNSEISSIVRQDSLYNSRIS